MWTRAVRTLPVGGVAGQRRTDEVWQARDTDTDRIVAINLLPRAFPGEAGLSAAIPSRCPRGGTVEQYESPRTRLSYFDDGVVRQPREED